MEAKPRSRVPSKKVVIEVDDAEGLRALGMEDDIDQPQKAFEWFPMADKGRGGRGRGRGNNSGREDWQQHAPNFNNYGPMHQQFPFPPPFDFPLGGVPPWGYPGPFPPYPPP